ncbi:hypothetical protein RugamoR1_24730 [Rugamonas sp. R1(2021)]
MRSDQRSGADSSRFFTDEPPRPPLACLAEIAPDYALVQEFRPLSLSLAAQVASAHWSRRGTAAFAEEQVPYAVTSDGHLSSCAAGVMFVHCEEMPPAADITVLELGAGSGLFARFFLDVFRDLCRREGRDYYERLTYFVTDGSEATVRQWHAQAVFSDHAEHVRAGVCNAAGGAIEIDGVCVEPLQLRAVFANYVLDILPTAILRRSPSGVVEELCSRVWVNRKSAALQRHGLDEQGVCALFSDASEAAQERLERLLPELTVETAFLECLHPPGYADQALALVPPQAPGYSSHGALDALAFWQGRLLPGGFILLADYGPLTPDEIEPTGLDRFGPTVAAGLNFALLDSVTRTAGWHPHAPPGDAELPIHPRLIVDRELPQTVACFKELYDGQRFREVEMLLAQARSAAHSGRLDEASQYYRLVVESRQTDWRLLGEVADFAHFQLRKPHIALELIRSALALNPCYSAALWNTYGDSLFDCGRPQDAHEAFLVAQRIHPSDVRAKYGLVFTYAHQCRHADALAAVAAALAIDRDGAYRERLLGKQREILDAAAADWERTARTAPHNLPSAAMAGAATDRQAA